MKKLVLMVGAQGSTKSTTARKLVADVQSQGLTGVVLSTDDFFMVGGKYCWDGGWLKAAHEWNRWRCYQAMNNGFNLVVIDNTNSQAWARKVYIELADHAGYEWECREPDCDWRYDAQKCFEKNQHNVPLETIQKVIDNILAEKTQATDSLLQSGFLVV